MRWLLLPLFVTTLNARVILISLDGLGHEALTSDPAAQELTALKAIARKGVQADGLTPAFPSTTANSHAAIFTGAWGNINGITSNYVPLAPKSEHTAFERVIGYRSDQLRAEPLWVAAARQGIRTVAVQVTQAYPFRPLNTGTNLETPPVVVNGYQTKMIAGHRVLRAKDVQFEACPAGSKPKAKCFQWKAGPIVFRGVLDCESNAGITITAGNSKSRVVARHEPLETEPPHKRELARHFSDGLVLDNVPDSTPAVVYFRLFELETDGKDFLLYQTPIHELGIHHGSEPPNEIVTALMREAGGFIGNGPPGLVREPFLLGTPLWKGGDGSAERRHLEIAELITRQSIRHAEWFLKRYRPELFLGYLNHPDEFEHSWKGLSATNPKYTEFRRWGYVMVNRLVESYAAQTRPEDHLLFVSDHGMTSVTHEVAINAALREAGLLEVNDKGEPDPARTQAMHIRNCILLNTADWKGGIVPLAHRTAVVDQVKKTLLGIKDHSGNPVITRIYDTAEDASRFGYGGPNGSDLCFVYQPGYTGNDSSSPPVIRKLDAAVGYHGFDPTRPSMKAILVGQGPRLRAGVKLKDVRSIDIAPLVSDILGIEKPKQAVGRSPVP
ncbi:MAG TPA: alkaline phosphatase family protein [Bryobacteraceae bacterium]|nr:alkaline phosphatase family protein [Bryobacteraceae bacterium]